VAAVKRSIIVPLSVFALFAATCQAAFAGASEIGITSGYSFDPYPAADRGPAVGAHYCQYFLQDLGLKVAAMAKWDRPVLANGKKAGDYSLLFQGNLGLQYIVDIGAIDPYLGAGGAFFYGNLEQGNTWAFAGYIGAGVAYTFLQRYKIGLELDYYYTFNAQESFPQFLMIQLEISFLFGLPSETLSRI
jgi:hypothetical protein